MIGWKQHSPQVKLLIHHKAAYPWIRRFIYVHFYQAIGGWHLHGVCLKPSA
jgi:hypothetical protein